PQIALSLGNSIIATSLLVSDLYPERGDIRVEKISRTYGLMNLIVPFLRGIPVCHGAGGLAGHYRFGARTGGSVVIYGLVYVVFGMFFSSAIGEVVKIFPFPILGVLLFFEGFALVQLLRHVPMIPKEFPVALIVGILIIGIPYGFLIGMICGIFIFYLLRKNKITL
ncbi:MAG: putative sulfate/molybdate transporter, partial [Candidatus Binatia bacterium]